MVFTDISYNNYRIVSKVGKYTTIQGAINSISDATTTNRYLVYVMPGLYTEQITMQPYVDLRGAGKHATQLQYTGDNNGTIIMANSCQVEDLLIEETATDTEWGIVSTNKSNIHIRNVDILGPLGTKTSQGIKITGDDFVACFIEHCVINYMGTTGYGIYIAGKAAAPQNCDTHIVDTFVDSFFATSGGGVYLKDCYAARIRNGLYRTSANGYNLQTSRTTTGTVDVMLENTVFEYGTASLEVGSNTSVYVKNCQIDSWTGTPTFFSPRFSSVKLSDSNNTHHLTLDTTSDLTSNRSLHLVPGDSDRTITLSGNPTLADWFDQAVKTTTTGVVFAGLAVTNAATTHIDMNVGAAGRAAQLHVNRGGALDTYFGPTATNEIHLWSLENIPFVIGLNNAEVFRVAVDSTAHMTKLLSDHIGEHTGAHGVVFDNDISRVGKLSIDHIAEATGAHKIIFDNDLSRVGKLSIDHIAEATGSHKVYFDNAIQLSVASLLFPGNTRGDLWYGDGSGGQLALGTGAVHAFLLQHGTAGTAAPAWHAIADVQDLISPAWTTPTFDAANFAATSSMTWTVASGDVTTYAYQTIGKKMTVAFYIGPSDIGGTPDYWVTIKIPDSKTATKTVRNACVVYDNSVQETGYCQVSAAGTVIYVGRLVGSVWTSGSNVSYAIGVISFEIN